MLLPPFIAIWCDGGALNWEPVPWLCWRGQGQVCPSTSSESQHSLLHVMCGEFVPLGGVCPVWWPHNEAELIQSTGTLAEGKYATTANPILSSPAHEASPPEHWNWSECCWHLTTKWRKCGVRGTCGITLLRFNQQSPEYGKLNRTIDFLQGGNYGINGVPGWIWTGINPCTSLGVGVSVTLSGSARQLKKLQVDCHMCDSEELLWISFDVTHFLKVGFLCKWTFLSWKTKGPHQPLAHQARRSPHWGPQGGNFLTGHPSSVG